MLYFNSDHLFSFWLLLIWGVLALMTNDPLASGRMIAAIAALLVAMTSAYPIFAIGIAEEKISKLEQEVRELQENTKENNRAINHITFQNTSNSFLVNERNSANGAKKAPYKLPSYKEAMDFVNRKHGVSLLPDDDLSVIKEKIKAIDDGGFTALIFKRRVSEATTKDEIESIFVMHAEEYD